MAPERSHPAPIPIRSLSDEAFRSGIAVDHAVDARYSWDAGIAIGRYLDELKQGRIIGRACHGCRRILVPPRMFCEQCFRPTDEWMHVRDTGTVNTFSLAYITWDMRELTDPDIPAVIDLDGASPGIGIMHKLGDVDPEAVHTGMRVRAVWKPPSERTGSILDIAYWAPIDEGAARGPVDKARKAIAKRAAKVAPKVASKAPPKRRGAR